MLETVGELDGSVDLRSAFTTSLTPRLSVREAAAGEGVLVNASKS